MKLLIEIEDEGPGEKLDALAKREMRSRSAQAKKILLDGLDREEAPTEPKTEEDAR